MDDNADLLMRLNKLSQIITEKEAELENISEIGMGKAGVDSNYVRDLRSRHLTYQREYNTILDQYPSLANYYSRIVIDTFNDSWLEKKEYQILEPVEINLKKRLSQKSGLYLTAKIGEDEQYEIYSIDGSFIRLEKRTGASVYLGEGHIPLPQDDNPAEYVVHNEESVAAAVYNHWVYWYESGNSLSDKFIYRRSLDGQLNEKLDLISNEKSIETTGHSAQSVSEDSVRRMFLKTGSLIIEVFRITQNATYQIVVNEYSGVLNVERIFPWETIINQKSTSDYIPQRQFNKQAIHHMESDLSNNPFYVLEVAPTDKRSTIIVKAEEKAFFTDGNICNEAQASLLSPAKRLSAEMDWFCGCTAETIIRIRASIENNTAISTGELDGLAKLNATLFNFAVTGYSDYFDIGYAILDIDEQYAAIDEKALTNTVNACHAKAGILQIAEDEISRELNKKREQVRRLITEKTQDLSEEDYIELITMIAEKCIADEDYSDGVIISDLVDQYELKMQPSIEAASNEIIAHIERIKKIASKEGIEANIAGLMRLIKKWDKLVQPLQLRSMASGVAHQTSEYIGSAVHELCLWLNNDNEMTETAFLLANAMKEVFAEIGSLSDIFGSASNALSRILKEDRDSKEIIAEISVIEGIIDKWKVTGESTNSYTLAANVITENTVNDLIANVKALNAKIKSINTDEESKTRLRTALCIAVRDGAVYAHNERHQTAFALSIAKMLLAEFGDIAELHRKLSEDVSALNRQLIAINASHPTYTPSHQQPQNSNSGYSKKGWVIVVAVFAAIIIAVTGGKDSPNNSSQSSGNEPSYNQSSEVKFSSSVNSGTDVYTDIVSIFPAIGVYTEGSSSYTHFVCKCERSSGSIVWVYISASEYKKHFDSDVSTSISSSAAEEITFYSSKRIHGVAKECDSVVPGLSSDTGTTLLVDFDYVS